MKPAGNNRDSLPWPSTRTAPNRPIATRQICPWYCNAGICLRSAPNLNRCNRACDRLRKAVIALIPGLLRACLETPPGVPWGGKRPSAASSILNIFRNMLRICVLASIHLPPQSTRIGLSKQALTLPLPAPSAKSILQSTSPSHIPAAPTKLIPHSPLFPGAPLLVESCPPYPRYPRSSLLMEPAWPMDNRPGAHGVKLLRGRSALSTEHLALSIWNLEHESSLAGPACRSGARETTEPLSLITGHWSLVIDHCIPARRDASPVSAQSA